MRILYDVQYAEYVEYVQNVINMTNMTNMHDMTNMSNMLNMQIHFAYAHPPFEYRHPLFYITNITNMQQICNKYRHPYFYIPKNIKYEKNAEYDIHPPGLTAAVRPGVGTKKYDKYAKYAKSAE